MTQLIPKLKLHDINDSALSEYATDKVTKVSTNVVFVAVNPSTAAMAAKEQEYSAALVKTDNGTKADTAYKKQKRKELEALLTAQAQDCARIANGDLAVYLSSGYEAKDIKGSPKGTLRQVTGVSLFFGNNDGELKIGWDTMREALNFTVQVFSDISNPDGSILKEYIIGKIGRSKAILSELPSGSKVFARVRANGGSTGHGAWSDPTEKRVP